MSGLGFLSVQVMSGGLRQWQQAGGALQGENGQATDLGTITATQFRLVQFQPGWLVVNRGAPADLAGWPTGWPVTTIPFDRESFASNLVAAARGDALTRRILLANARGENYNAVSAVLKEPRDFPVFFLAGGLQAYQEQLAREVAMQNRRLVTLSSDTSTRFKTSGRLAMRAGGCCGGRK